MVCSPRAEDDGTGRILRSTVAVWFRRRRLELLCWAAALLCARGGGALAGAGGGGTRAARSRGRRRALQGRRPLWGRATGAAAFPGGGALRAQMGPAWAAAAARVGSSLGLGPIR
jgi:hypothetical protein